MINNQNFKNFVLKQLPEDIATYLVKGLTKIYQDSYNHVFEKYEREQAMDLLPHYRRTEIESFLRLLSNQFPSVSVNCIINGSFNSFHVEVNINRIIFTQSFSNFPDERIRDAKFRNSLSEFNIQLELNFPDDKIKTKEVVGKYYAILQHGAEGREAQRPQFFNLVFPTTDGENIADPIDILKLYNISSYTLQSDTETIESGEALTNPPLKTPTKTADEGNQ